jgi:hypothetical protein
MKSLIAIAILGLATFAAPARAETWDSKGWVKLGEREVNGKVDHDQISVGKYEGKFSKLTLVVEKSDLELLEFQVVFGNGQRWNPNVRHEFKEGSRTRVIDLPGDERIIKTIELKYKNLPGGGRAKVEVWGLKELAGGGGGKKSFKWDSNGWKMLGERTVNGKVDHDRINVGTYKGKFAKLTVVVLDSDLEMLDFDVKFGNGQNWNPGLKHVFKEDDRSRVIDLPGDERVIKTIDIKYKNLPGGGAAKVQVWAK